MQRGNDPGDGTEFPPTSSSSSSVHRTRRGHTHTHHTNGYDSAKKHSSDQVTWCGCTASVATTNLERSTKSLWCPLCSTSPAYPDSREKKLAQKNQTQPNLNQRIFKN